MEVKAIIRPLLKCVHSVFDLQCNLKLLHQGSSLLEKGVQWQGDGERQLATSANLSSIGNHNLSMTIAFCFSEDVYLGLVSSMLNDDFLAVRPAIRDLAAEWLNTVLEQLKSILNQDQQGDFVFSMPVTIAGEKLFYPTDDQTPVFVIRFSSEKGDFVCLLILGKKLIIPWDKSIVLSMESLDAVNL